MEAVVYSTFRNHLKDYMKKVNDEFEPLAVVRIVQNKELSDKVLRGMAQVRAGETQEHAIKE